MTPEESLANLNWLWSNKNPKTNDAFNKTNSELVDSLNKLDDDEDEDEDDDSEDEDFYPVDQVDDFLRSGKELSAIQKYCSHLKWTFSFKFVVRLDGYFSGLEFFKHFMLPFWSLITLSLLGRIKKNWIIWLDRTK